MTPDYEYNNKCHIRFFNCDNMDFMKEIPDNYYDLAIVDLEYNIGASKPSKKPELVKQKNGNLLKVKNSNKYKQREWDFKMSSKEYLENLFRISKNQIIWGGNYYGLVGGYIVWDKLNGESDQFGCELAYQSFDKRTDIVRFMWSGMFQGVYCGKDVRLAIKQQGNKSLNEERIHETQKPIALYRWLLQNYAKQGDKILDTHGGSMTIARACYEEGFDLDIMELDKEYFDKGVQKFKEHVSQIKLF